MNVPRHLVALLAVFGATTLGCGGMLSAAGKAQEAAINLNMDARLGRNEFCLEHVEPQHREKFTKVHTLWSRKYRVVDSEITAFKMGKDDETAGVDVQVSWYRPQSNELHVTVLHQKWKDINGDWFLSSEERVDGDTGLLGEHVEVAQPETSAPNALFQTVRIGED
jgi:hypothetical protein